MRYNAGRQTDAIIAEKVMGLEPWPGLKAALMPPAELPDLTPMPLAPQPYTTELVADGYEVALVSTAGHQHRRWWARRISAEAAARGHLCSVHQPASQKGTFLRQLGVEKYARLFCVYLHVIEIAVETRTTGL